MARRYQPRLPLALEDGPAQSASPESEKAAVEGGGCDSSPGGDRRRAVVERVRELIEERERLRRERLGTG